MPGVELGQLLVLERLEVMTLPLVMFVKLLPYILRMLYMAWQVAVLPCPNMLAIPLSSAAVKQWQRHSNQIRQHDLITVLVTNLLHAHGQKVVDSSTDEVLKLVVRHARRMAFDTPAILGRQACSTVCHKMYLARLAVCRAAHQDGAGDPQGQPHSGGGRGRAAVRA